MFVRKLKSDIARENCIVCAIWPLLFFVPYYCIQYTCPHRNSTKNKTTFNLSLTRTTITLFILLFSFKKLFDISIYYVSSYNNVYIFFYIHESFAICAYILVIFACVLYSDRKLDSLQGHQELIEFLNASGTFLNLNESDLKKLRKRSVGCVLFCMLQIMIYSYFYFAVLTDFGDVLAIFVSFFGEITMTLFLLLHAYVFYLECCLQIMLQRKLFMKIKAVLKKRQMDFVVNDTFIANLEKCRFLYILIMKNFRVFFRFYSRNILILYTIILLLLIYNVFFLLLLIKWAYFDNKFVLILLNSYFNCLVIIQFNWVGDIFENTVSYKYTIILYVSCLIRT